MSPVPDQNAWDIDALIINWSGLTAYAYPPMALLHRVIQNQKIQLLDHCNSPRLARDALVLGPSPALNSDPTLPTSVNKSSQTVPQLCVFTAIHNISTSTWVTPRTRLLCGGGRENCCTSKFINKDHLQVKWALFGKWCRENLVDFSTPSVKQVSDFFMYLYQDLNRCPSTIDGYRTAIVDTFGPSGAPYFPKLRP